MVNKKKRIFYIVLSILLCLVAVSPVLAATQSAVLIDTGLGNQVVGLGSTYGVGSCPIHQSFYAEGRNWLFYMDYDTVADDSDIVYTSAVPGQTWATPTVAVNDCGLYAIEFAVWYDQLYDVVHYARHDMTPEPDEVKYRMGTPDSDGTITWAASEQTVSTTPADLLTWRTTIACDESGYPWVAWIDTNGVDSYGIVYVESSTTRNGTWTQDVNITTNFDETDQHAWYVALTPIEVGTDVEVMEVEFSREEQDILEPNYEDVTLVAYRWDNTGAGAWSAEDTVADYGDMNSTRPDAFSFYDVDADMWCVYTDELGSVLCRERASTEAWYEADAAEAIKEEPGEILLPTLSGYNSSGVGDNLICIVNSSSYLKYSTHTYGDAVDEWTTWSSNMWTVSSEDDTITRHIANYKYESPTGFSWQIIDDSDDPDTDDVYTWWITPGHGVGYYPSDYGLGGDLLTAIMPAIIALGIVIAGLGIWKGNFIVAGIGIIIGVVGLFFVQGILGIMS